MSLFNNVLAGASGQQGYTISRSVRLRSSASAYFNRTTVTPTTGTKFTLSFWMKHCSVTPSATTSYEALFSSPTHNSDKTFLSFSQYSGYDNFELYFAQHQGSSAAYFTLKTTQVFRDPSAWYHVIYAWDSTQATASDRIKVYVNGVQVTAFSVANYPPQNHVLGWQTAGKAFTMGYSEFADYFNGYLTEAYFVDGQQLTPSSFGETNTTTGVWQPKKYTGTYGNNGWYVNFSDNSASTATTIGKDYSGNGNNWTPNNISVTAGVTYDSMVDSPTVGATSSNYCVLNPLDKVNLTGSPTNGNLTLTGANDGGVVAGTIGMSSGKWYYEHTITAIGGQQSVGIGTSVGAASNSAYIGIYANQYGYYTNGNKYTNATATAYGATYTTGDVIGVAYDADAGSLTFYKNGTSQGVAFTGLSGTFFALAATRTTGGTNISNLNFGQRPFSYTPPTGFVALNTQNLPAPTISNGAQYMAATTYAGTGATNVLSNGTNNPTATTFQPDLVWIKVRTNAYYHKLFDSVRGANKALSSNATDAESTETQGLLSFNSNGFTLGTSSDSTVNNAGSGQTYVGWNWKAGGTAVSNTAGTITSSVSANPTAGFSIITWTGTNASSATVGHGLGVAPKFFVIKQRNGSTYNWLAYHASVGAGSYLTFSGTAAATADTAMWSNTAPTSSVITLSSGANIAITNPTSGTMLIYCFAPVAGYSAFGSYTGNGSADGPFVYCGFRPRFLMIKNTTNAQPWIIIDTSRNPYNQAGDYLQPNSSAAENGGSAVSTATADDILSNGFKLRNNASSSGYTNASGATYIFMAVAENPFKNSLAR